MVERRARLDARVPGRDLERDARRETASAPAASNDWRATSRPANATAQRQQRPRQRPGSRRGAGSRRERSAAGSTRAARAAASATIGAASAGDCRPRGPSSTSTALTSRSSSDGSRSSMKRATCAIRGTWRGGHSAQAAPTASSRPRTAVPQRHRRKRRRAPASPEREQQRDGQDAGHRQRRADDRPEQRAAAASGARTRSSSSRMACARAAFHAPHGRPHPPIGAFDRQHHQPSAPARTATGAAVFLLPVVAPGRRAGRVLQPRHRRLELVDGQPRRDRLPPDRR